VNDGRRRARLHLRAAAPGEEPAPVALGDVLDACPEDVAELPVPPGWRVTENGVYEVVTRFGEAGPYQAAEAAWEHVLKFVDTIPLWKRALAVLQSWAAENAHRIAGMEIIGPDGKARPPAGGYIGGLVTVEGRPAVGFFPNAFDEAIKKHLGIEGPTIREGLAREGVILRDKEGRCTRSQWIRPAGSESFKTRVICVAKEKVFPEGDEAELQSGPLATNEWPEGEEETGLF